MTVVDRIHAAPIEAFLEARGFRQERKRYTCHAHEDKRPSATVWKNRLKCWVCNREWSSIDLVMEMDGANLSAAIAALADFYNISTERSSPERRRDYEQQTRDAQALAERLMDFTRGLQIISDRRIEAAALGINPEAIQDWHLQAHALRVATPMQIADIWRRSPAERAAVERLGRADRESAEAITWIIVDMLAAQQKAEAA